MKTKIFLILLLSLVYCFEENTYTSTITFSSNGIKASGDEVKIDGTNATILKSGSYLVTGNSNEGNVIVNIGNVDLYLKDLELSSSITSPIIVNSKLKDVKIISIENVVLKDLEDSSSTSGECAVIKIKKKSEVTFQNQKDFELTGNCKNVIKGGEQASIIFSSSSGEYKVNGYQNGISSDGLLTFNGGIFTIKTETGDAIKSSPDDDDNVSLGKIIINDGTFNIESYSDAFQAKNNIIIKNGKFNIKAENGYNSNTFKKETGSAKGFKVSNNATGCEIRIYNGEFILNTADDAFHSNGNLTLINGSYQIYSGDDGLHAEFHLLIGKNDSSITPIINVLSSYEAIEGMSIRIYSGKINVSASDDGLNAAGGSSSDEQPRPGPHLLQNKSVQEPKPPSGNSGNSSYFISIYGGEINVFCDGDGIDSNGNIFIHGGDINIFSAKSGDNEPIDHDGNLTLFSANVLGVGSKGMEYIHEGIQKGNQMYAYCAQSINQNKLLKIKNENGEIVKQGYITKNIDYIFYTSSDLNENYKLYISDNDGNNERQYTFKFSNPASGSDDQDNRKDDGGADWSDEEQSDEEEKSDEQSEDEQNDKQSDGEKGDDSKNGNNENNENDGNSTKTFLIYFFSILIPLIVIIILIIIFRKRCNKKNNEESLINSIDNKEMTES